VWYDEHNLASGALMDVIQRELRARPIFVVILSSAALKSRWVLDECKWAHTLKNENPAREIVPAVASRFDLNMLPLHLYDYRRIEANKGRPFPPDEAIRRLVQVIGRAGNVASASPSSDTTAELVANLIAEGEAIQDKNPAQAIALFEQARRAAPDSGAVWFHLGSALWAANRNAEALEALSRAITYDPKYAPSWEIRGDILHELHRDAEALIAYDQALTIDGESAGAWVGKGNVLYVLSDYVQALDAYEYAAQYDPEEVAAWTNIGACLAQLGRPKLALDAYEQALEIDPIDADIWDRKRIVLEALGWNRQAEQAAEQVRILRVRER
jgi:tetratricopeptide (TPR) repeat protein